MMASYYMNQQINEISKFKSEAKSVVTVITIFFELLMYNFFK